MAPPKKTVSTCKTETVRRSHLFHIRGYDSLRKELCGDGGFIRSDTFTVAGHEWSVLYFPDGETQGYVSVFVELMSEATVAWAFLDLRLVNHTTKCSRSVSRTRDPVMFDSSDEFMARWCVCRFMERSKLRASPYVRGDLLTIECVVSVVKNPRVYDSNMLLNVEVPPSNIKAQLGKLLEEKEGADVTFVVDGKSFAAHKLVLAMRSPVFKAQLYGPMKEKDMGRVSVDDMQPAVFEAMLHFIYTDELPDMIGLRGESYMEMIRHLLVAGDRYAVERLKQMCESILCRMLEAETVATTLALADGHHCHKLKEACIEFMNSSERKDKVVASAEYECMAKSVPSLLIGLWGNK